jgi:hypothetical protein
VLILMIAVNDPAGMGIKFCRAVNRLGRHVCRLATLETRYTHGWEADLHLPDLSPAGLAELERLLRQADVFHFHMTADENLALGPFLPRDFLAGKKIVHHHHGHPDYRSNPQKYLDKYERLNRRNILVSTPDLLKLLPVAVWQPNLVPIGDPLLLPAGDKPRDRLLVAHSPTRKDLKNTDDLLAAAAALREGAPGRLPVELDLIDDVPNAECLARKRRCHVLFDHMQGYYGVSSLEGLSQGLAVIAGLDEWNRARVAEFAGTTELPWITARDRAELAARLAKLASDLDACLAAGRKGRLFMERCWSDARVAGRLADYWERL